MKFWGSNNTGDLLLIHYGTMLVKFSKIGGGGRNFGLYLEKESSDRKK